MSLLTVTVQQFDTDLHGGPTTVVMSDFDRTVLRRAMTALAPEIALMEPRTDKAYRLGSKAGYVRLVRLLASLTGSSLRDAKLAVDRVLDQHV